MTILDRIVAASREDLERKKAKTSRSRLEERPLFDRTPLDFAAALRGSGMAFISEIKKASPSKGVIRPDFDASAIAERYEQAGADAISVLTEPRHFEGSLDDLSNVRAVTALPLLRKDFIIDPYQLFEARSCGADAVLLIAAVLDRIHLHDLIQATTELGLTPLVEVYDIAELDRIDFDAIDVLGVNNRDLRTFEVDVDHSIRVFREVPTDVVRVSESGISSAQELIHLIENGIDAVLIGETFMRADDPGDALEKLRADVQATVDR